MPVLLAMGTLLLIIFGRRLSVARAPWFGAKGGFATSRKTAGQKSEVRTEALRMELDHDSGRMEGQCLKGRFAGKALSSLDHHQLLQLLKELRATDHQGSLLIEAYLDQRSPDWRDRRSDDAARDGSRQPRASNGRMTTEEAYEVLGLQSNAKEPGDSFCPSKTNDEAPSRSRRDDLFCLPHQRGKRRPVGPHLAHNEALGAFLNKIPSRAIKNCESC